MFTYTIDEVDFRLQRKHDLSWLTPLGTVFAVFDEQDSGNLCFGVRKNEKRYFVKYAGAKPMDFNGDPHDAVARLREAVPLYKELSHPHLIQYVDEFPTDEGHVALFDWFNGECLHSHWSFPPPAKYTNPNSPYYKYKHLPLEKRLASFDAILEFHAFIEAKGYVAIDFYDGSILYDFNVDQTKICDIDFYRPSPVINDVGESFWGSTRSKSPEEYYKGALIDNRSNVFMLGSIAFSIFGGEMDHAFKRWESVESLFQVAKKAVEPERYQRFSSVQQLKDAWELMKRREGL